jgi:hypothetical protein
MPTLRFKKTLNNLRSHFNDNSNQQIPQDSIRVHTPPSDIPSNIPSDDQSSIPKNILAFRTITAMLAQLQPKQTSGRDIRDALLDMEDSNPGKARHARREVRMSDALAHLAIIDHDVVALATEYSGDKMTVVACANTPEVPLEKEPKPYAFIDHIKSFLFTKNPRDDDLVPVVPVTHPQITPATQPDDLGSQTLHDYIKKLNGIL